MTSKSAAIVGFIANLMPLYEPEQLGDIWCARSLTDGTLVLPVDEATAGVDPDEEQGWVRVRWQGDPNREIETFGANIATLAVIRYIELNSLGQPAKKVAVELEHLERHFMFKTGCSLYLHAEIEAPSALMVAVRKAAGRMGERALADLILSSI